MSINMKWLKRLLVQIVLIAIFLLTFAPASSVLAEETSKKVEIDLTNQRLYAFEGGQKIYDFVISSGKPWWPTPVGTFKPWIKLLSSRMQGGSVEYGTYYDLPNVPFVIYFGNEEVPNTRGYGLHGTYWHNNFGYPMSHGCVNLRTEDMQKLYFWMDLTTPIRIFGQTPVV
ncbi:hypothetical protein A2867_05240 [Candidatus Daviesbacteria bacterium RIFCSPHIGHO2_01_FULL_40_11]|uniref:L,D-TPase catalytic domain-containing protein n=1 Tax=Candidatus Daviesbacteria bacterium RIFCSPHIGHO2_01_FULL_40_11 TaxID=1797762 RepID=A0A1F5JKY3_9BACT|nr:MAG: hypothetical protein A2867_05240 [Candidatus Daviesbacteria bacterium RIFCSPHIGHO2_01_FULL_40_11]OGE63161.1 MAG: hypothetical protein A2964_00995 [Candidatus Daviesbacteria bacterium RIFCSPLOWO2_01_FULL_40_27]